MPHIYGEHEMGGTNHLYLAALPFDKLGLPDTASPRPRPRFRRRIQHTIYKGFIAPVALYGTLCFIAVRNLKKQAKQATTAHDARPQEGSINGPRRIPKTGRPDPHHVLLRPAGPRP